MTDEQLSELAEALDDACQERVREGWTITAGEGVKHCCPFGALGHRSHPMPYVMRQYVPENIAASFMNGFDGNRISNLRFFPRSHLGFDIRAFNLGRSFRVRYGVAS